MVRKIPIVAAIAAAGIATTDERGRTVDLHCLRHTFGTHLAMAGVAPRTAMAAMRHSSSQLTMNVYTGPTLLDVAGAITELPKFSISKQASHHDCASYCDDGQ